MVVEPPPFPADDVQGFGLAGFRKDHQRLLAVRFGSQAAGQKIVARLADEAATHNEVASFNRLFAEVRARRQREDEDDNGEVLSALWTAGLLSAVGLRTLGVDPTAGAPAGEGPAAFVAGMAARAEQLADPPATQWEAAVSGVDCLVVLAGDIEDEVSEAAEKWRDFVQAVGGQVLWSEVGATLTGPQRGHEHFGFKDGISQPAVNGVDDPPGPGEPPAAPLGEFLLGYPDANGTTATVSGPYVNASFVVFRRLTQDVATFREISATAAKAVSPPLTTDQMQAKMVGRWPSGAPLEGNPTGDPGTPSNAFDYQAADPAGQVCPLWSHLRKANPRDETTPDPSVDNPALHRMIRRGIPFGPRLADEAGTTDDGSPRGLHFFAVVSDLVRQFEFVQINWLNSSTFPGGQPGPKPGSYNPTPGTPDAGADPIAGQGPQPDVVQLVQPSGVQAIPFPKRVVTMTGGEYFLLPSITGLKALAKDGSGA